MNLSEKWKIKVTIARDDFKKAQSIQGVPKEKLTPLYSCLYVKTPNHVILIHPDLETIQN